MIFNFCYSFHTIISFLLLQQNNCLNTLSDNGKEFKRIEDSTRRKTSKHLCINDYMFSKEKVKRHLNLYSYNNIFPFANAE